MFFFSLRRTFLAPAPVRPLGGLCWVLLSFEGRDPALGTAREGLLLAAGLLLAGHGALGPLAGPCVGLGALSTHRQATAVPQPLVAADLDLAADVGSDLATQVALELEGALEVVTQPDE